MITEGANYPLWGSQRHPPYESRPPLGSECRQIREVWEEKKCWPKININSNSKYNLQFQVVFQYLTDEGAISTNFY